MDKNELIDVLDYEKVGIKFLVISGSPRSEKVSRSAILAQEVIAGAQEIDAVEIIRYSFGNKRIAPLHVGANAADAAKDDFPAFYEKWLEADAVIWSVPIYHMGPPSLVRAALNRLSDMTISSSREADQPYLPRPSKVVGAVVQGNSRFGGQEITMLYMMQHAHQMRCLWVSADMPESYHGVCAHVLTAEGLRADTGVMNMARELGRRAAETAKFVKAGLMLSESWLPDEYYPSRTTAGLIDRKLPA